MIGQSIRVRLTAWYVTVLAVATLTLTGASWWLSSQSVDRAADISLHARIEGVQRFLENPRTRLTVERLRDEFREYAELTQSEALLEVIDGNGVVLCQPSVPGWTDMTDAEAARAGAANGVPVVRLLGGLPFRVAMTRVEAAGRQYRVTVAAPMGPSQAALERFHRLLIWLWPAVLAFAGAGGYWVSRRALAPVAHMTDAVQAITVESLDRRLELPPADDELRRLASTFNDMLARLQSAVNDIVRFTADASHELRTPVALIRTTAELSLRQARTPGEYRQALDEVLDYARHMSGLVEDLLILARSDAGLDPAGREAVDIGALAAAAGREVQPLADRRSVHLGLEPPSEPFIVRGNGQSLHRLLLILLDNALRYTPPGGHVDLRVRPASRDGDTAPGVLIEVSDDGIGLDPVDGPRLFERFYRGARARRHAPDGSGLGLAIAQTIVNLHGGSIAVTAVDPAGDRRGCLVRVRMPLDPDAPPQAASGPPLVLAQEPT